MSQRKNICPQQPGPTSDFPEIITCGRNIPTCGPHQCRLWWGDRRWEVEKLDCPPVSWLYRKSDVAWDGLCLVPACPLAEVTGAIWDFLHTGNLTVPEKNRLESRPRGLLLWSVSSPQQKALGHAASKLWRVHVSIGGLYPNPFGFFFFKTCLFVFRIKKTELALKSKPIYICNFKMQLRWMIAFCKWNAFTAHFLFWE